MKWIGEHIWNFISRFKSDVYLESISSGTISSGGHLGLDANDKIVKAAVDTDLVNDTTPQLGGDLDVNGNKITSNGNGDIIIDPAGTGEIHLKSDNIKFYTGGAINAGTLKLSESPLLNGDYVSISSPFNLASTYGLTLPNDLGSAGQALKTDASGNLSWTDFASEDNPTFNGVVSIKPLAGDARLALYEDDGTNYVVVQAQDSLSSSWTLELPTDAGTSGQVLGTNGSGVTSWVNTDKYWHETIGGYKTSWSNSTTYYTFYRVWFENWANADSTPTSVSFADYMSCFFIAPRAGTVTNIRVSGYSSNTDPFKFYIYKATPLDNVYSVTASSLVTTGTITPPAANRTFNHTVDFSSSNSFAEGDLLFVWAKKDSHSVTQNTYWHMNINGEYN